MAGQGTVSINAFNDPNGFTEIAAATIAAAAAGLIAGDLGLITDNTKMAVIQPNGGDVYWRDDGTDPTAIKGMLLTDGSVLQYTGKMNKIKFIKAAGTPKVDASFYK